MRSSTHIPVFMELESRRLFSGGDVPTGQIDLFISNDAETQQTVVTAESAQTPTTTMDRFHWFDGGGYQTFRPSLTTFGLDGFTVSAHRLFVDFNPHADISEEYVRAEARAVKARGQIMSINIESWKTNRFRFGDQTVTQSIARFEQLIGWIKDEEPELKLGVYAMWPVGDYWLSTGYNVAQRLQDTSPWWKSQFAHSSNAQAQWEDANNRLEQVAQLCDFIMPSLYTFYEDRQGWVDFAKGLITEAKRYGKPVIPFILPKFHDASVGGARFMDQEYWQLQLDTVREYADSAVIWMNHIDVWTESTPWIQTLTAKVNADNPPASAPLALARSEEPAFDLVSLDLFNQSEDALTDEDFVVA
jgi:hypothetical protein